LNRPFRLEQWSVWFGVPHLCVFLDLTEEIDSELIVLDETDAVTLALRVAAAVSSDGRNGDD
jgi:hypothetical protein